MNNILEKIIIPNEREIRGNITLSDEIEGAKITWTSSHPHIISDTDQGALLKGVVNRQAEDTEVVLSAQVSKDGVTAQKEIKVRVVKAPKEVTETDYEGYLFGHFIGEETENHEQIYFAASNNRLQFKDLNGKKPVLVSSIGEKGVRDPYLCRSKEGDRFFLIATDLSIYHRGGWFKNEQDYYDASTTGSPYLVLWQSNDLIHWDEPKLCNVAPENAGMAWAPEMIYNDETGEYIIFFASSIMDPKTKMKAKPNAIYYVATRDFETFSETRLFIDNQTDGSADGKKREIIDTTVIKIGDTYYSASKDGDNDEECGGIRILKSKNLLDADAWEMVLNLDQLGLDTEGLQIDRLDNSTLEGPELFQYNQKDWADPNVPEYGIMADQYMAGTGYLPLTTTDLEDKDNSKHSWKILKKDEYSFDTLKKRHGTILRITKDEYEALMKAYGV